MKYAMFTVFWMSHVLCHTFATHMVINCKIRLDFKPLGLNMTRIHSCHAQLKAQFIFNIERKRAISRRMSRKPHKDARFFFIIILAL